MWDDDRLTRMFEQIVQGYNDGWVKPHVDSVFDFDHSCDAHEYIENRKNVGKVVLVPTEFLVKEWNKRR
jgi:NADPH:quinone reductase-like Zn-dependent oxidoreductase